MSIFIANPKSPIDRKCQDQNVRRKTEERSWVSGIEC